MAAGWRDGEQALAAGGAATSPHRQVTVRCGLELIGVTF
jgi:hypothetical protein